MQSYKARSRCFSSFPTCNEGTEAESEKTPLSGKKDVTTSSRTPKHPEQAFYESKDMAALERLTPACFRVSIAGECCGPQEESAHSPDRAHCMQSLAVTSVPVSQSSTVTLSKKTCKMSL